MIFVKSVLMLLAEQPNSWPFAFCAPLLFVLYALSRFPPESRINRLIAIPGLTLAVFTILAFFWLDSTYLASPIYLGWIDPQIAGVSWYFMLGHPLYHGSASSEIYEMLYGPYLYIFTGLAEKLAGPSVFSAKLAGHFSLLATFAFVYLLMRRRGMDRANSVLSLALLASVIMLINPEEFFSRADNFVILFVTIGCVAVYVKSSLGPLLLGLAVGVSMDLKIHSIVYFLPLFCIAFQNGYRFRQFAVVVCCLALAGLLPFCLFPNISLVNYLTTLAGFTKHGANAFNYLGTVDMFFGMGSPVLGIVLTSYIADSDATNLAIKKISSWSRRFFWLSSSCWSRRPKMARAHTTSCRLRC